MSSISSWCSPSNHCAVEVVIKSLSLAALRIHEYNKQADRSRKMCHFIFLKSYFGVSVWQQHIVIVLNF
ncbi:hypothetical protein Y1Q_0010885 [Alligator mississippiensis]|uniref:Uncharacterized protein n=1 Tax=Alligator mississippiensis TaxID=8496 RepID=A0A151M789_ALLMI|nr:hypothetical protein Y1Q_0010885 [Alligator mississippiensis]